MFSQLFSFTGSVGWVFFERQPVLQDGMAISRQAMIVECAFGSVSLIYIVGLQLDESIIICLVGFVRQSHVKQVLMNVKRDPSHGSHPGRSHCDTSIRFGIRSLASEVRHCQQLWMG